jgi:hypothetical protein
MPTGGLYRNGFPAKQKRQPRLPFGEGAFRSSGNLLLGTVFLAEALDAASGIDDFLLAGVEGVAGGADFDV